jgi:regulator of protease activity HflC (stomatin/prohibitin superfamily)
MATLIAVIVVIGVLALVGLAMSLRIVQQYEEGVLFRLGKVRGVASGPWCKRATGVGSFKS